MSGFKKLNEFASGYVESNAGITKQSVAISLTTLLHNTFLVFLPGPR